MSVKREPPEGVYGEVDPQGPRDMVRIRMIRSPAPVIHCRFPDHHTYAGSAGTDDTLVIIRMSRCAFFAPRYLPTAERRTIRSLKGQERVTYVALLRAEHTDRGMTYGARALWSRSPNSSRRAGKPPTWQSGAGSQTERKGRNARCDQPKPS